MTEWPSNPLMLVSIEGSSLTLIANMAARGSQLSCPLGVGGKREVFGMTNIECDMLKGGYPIIFASNVADFVYTSESNESCEKHSTQR